MIDLLKNIEFVRAFGLSVSLILIGFALYVRYSKKLDTTALAADWSLLLIAAAGLCMSGYFYWLPFPHLLAQRGWIVSLAVCLYIAALLVWYFGAAYQKIRFCDRCKEVRNAYKPKGH